MGGSAAASLQLVVRANECGGAAVLLQDSFVVVMHLEFRNINITIIIYNLATDFRGGPRTLLWL